MPSTRRDASRQTAKASGRSLSSASPLAMRSRNSGVLACSSASLSFSISGSSALMRSTERCSWRSRRSLRLPKMRVNRLLSIGVPGPEWMPPNANRAPGALSWRNGHSSVGAPPGVSTRQRRALAEELPRIDRAAVLPHLEVHVRTRGTPGRTGLGDLLPGADRLAPLAHQARVVRVAGHEAVAVGDLHGVTVPGLVAGEADHAIGDGLDRVADVGLEVDAGVELAAAPERVGTVAVVRGDVAVDRLARGHRGHVELPVEQQRLEHGELPPRGAELRVQQGQLVVELPRRHVLDVAVVIATHADRLVEVELAILQLPDAGQPLAQRIEPVGLGLQLAQARGQGVDLALRLLLGHGHFGLLRLQLGMHGQVAGDPD